MQCPLKKPAEVRLGLYAVLKMFAYLKKASGLITGCRTSRGKRVLVWQRRIRLFIFAAYFLNQFLFFPLKYLEETQGLCFNHRQFD